MSETSSIPIACNITALPPEVRETHLMNGRHIFDIALAIEELLDGYAIQLPNDTDTFLHIAQFVGRERACCPFFEFTLNLQPNDGAFWFRLTGDERVKPFIQSQLSINRA